MKNSDRAAFAVGVYTNLDGKPIIQFEVMKDDLKLDYLIDPIEAHALILMIEKAQGICARITDGIAQ